MLREVLARWSGRLAAFLRRIARALERLSGASGPGFAELAAQFPGAPQHWLRDVAALADDRGKIRRIKVAEPAPRAPRPVVDASPRPTVRSSPQEPSAIAKVSPQSPAPDQSSAKPKVRFLPPNANPRPPRFIAVDPPRQPDMRRAAPIETASDRVASRRQEAPMPQRRVALRLIPPAPEHAPAWPRADDAGTIPPSVRAETPSAPVRIPRTLLAGIRAALRSSLRPVPPNATSPPKPRHAATPSPHPRQSTPTLVSGTETVPPAAQREPIEGFAHRPRVSPPQGVAVRPGAAARGQERWSAPVGSVAAMDLSDRWPALPSVGDADCGIEPPRLHELRREQEQGLWSG